MPELKLADYEHPPRGWIEATETFLRLEELKPVENLVSCYKDSHFYCVYKNRFGYVLYHEDVTKPSSFDIKTWQQKRKGRI